jgi:hypothetical protein
MSLRLGAIRSLAIVYFVMAVLMAIISSVAAIRGGSVAGFHGGGSGGSKIP